MKHYGVQCVKRTLVSLSVSTLSLLLVVAILQVVKSSTANYIEGLTQRLAGPSRDDALATWHSTCLRVCDSNIERIVALACLHDPYRVNRLRRSANSTRSLFKQRRRHIATPTIRTKKENDHPVFLSKLRAASFLKTRHTRSASGTGGGPNILMECCIQKACVWEEYGEYCDMHSRHRPPAMGSVCGA